MLALRRFPFCVLVASGALFTVGTAAAAAQGKLEAQYTAYLAGLPIGHGRWVIDIGESTYSAAASGTTSGLLHAFTGGEGASTARGTLNGGRVTSSSYTADIVTRRRTDTVRLTINSGNVKELKVAPPRDPDDERVPIKETHKQNVLDPMTASLLRAPGSGDPLTPEACHRSLPVFDGKLRYDLQLSYKRMDRVKPGRGYAGPVMVCAVIFTPVAGFIPSRTAIRYLTGLKDIEVWLAPIAGTHVLVPFRVQGPTPIGQAVLEATQFVAAPVAAKPAATSSFPKTQ